MKAITTRYLPATSFKGARVKAYIEGGMNLSMPWNCELDQEMNHREIARRLTVKLEWDFQFVTGGVKDGYVHVLLETDDEGAGNDEG